MYAKRLNKTYAVETAKEKQDYLARGYDIYDDDNLLLEHSPQKSVPYAEHERLLTKHSLLQSSYEELTAAYVELAERGNAESAEPEAPPTPKAELDAPKMGSIGVATAEAVSEAAPKAGKRK